MSKIKTPITWLTALPFIIVIAPFALITGAAVGVFQRFRRSVTEKGRL